MNFSETVDYLNHLYEEVEESTTFNYGDFINNLDKYKDMLRGKAGIYLYINDANNHKYVGQAVDLYKRLLEHKNVAYRDSDEDLMPIDSAIKQYGPEKFTIKILKFIENTGLLDKWEIRYIEEYNTYNNIEDYNLTPGGNELNYFRQSIFWDDEKQKFDKRKLNKVRAFLQSTPLSFEGMVKDLEKPIGDTTKQSSVEVAMSSSTTATIRKINNCEGIYKLNYYERTAKGFSAPLSKDNHEVGRNQHAKRDFYIFDINEIELTPEHALEGPLPSWREVSQYINLGAETDDQQIKQISRGLKRDGRPGGNYIYKGYKIKSFVKED